MIVQPFSGESLIVPPNITIIKPINDSAIIEGNKVDLNWSSNTTLDWCAYSLDGGDNNTDICPIPDVSKSIGFTLWDDVTNRIGVVFYNDSSFYITGNITTIGLNQILNFTERFNYSIPNGFGSGNITGLLVNALRSQIRLFLNNGTMLEASITSINQNIDFIYTGKTYSLRSGYTTQDTIGFIVDEGDEEVGVFYSDFKISGGSWSNDNLNLGAFFLETATYPVGVTSSNIKGYAYANSLNHLAVFLNNGSQVIASNIGSFGNLFFRPFDTYQLNNLLDSQKNVTLSVSEGIHNVTIYGNNTEGDMGQTTYVYFNTTQPPKWDNNKTNVTSDTQLNYSIQLNVTLTDNYNLSDYIFSWDVPGFWVNFTPTTLNIINNETVIENKTINYSVGKKVNWTIYFNDTSGNTNQTDVFIFDIKNIPPTISNVSITPLPLQPSDNVKGHCLYQDADGDESGGTTTFYYVNRTLVNEANNTFILLSGNLTNDANITFSCKQNDTMDTTEPINSSQATVGDTIAPNLNNCILQFTTLTSASGNTNNFSCSATDLSSLVESIKFELQTPNVNLIRSFSSAQAQTVSSTFLIFESTESLIEGFYSIRNVTYKDTSGNEGTNQTTEFNFTITTVSSSPPAGGGGGGAAPAVNTTNKTIITGQCNFNNVCEAEFGEDFINCRQDCEFTTAQINPLCLFRPQPNVPCVYRTGIFVQLTVALFIIATLILLSDSPQGLKVRNFIKKKTKIDILREVKKIRRQ